ncbi:hypothetical protein BU17DRAFT_60405 [Hysterangium stoloniferum]|nr:hypothetical protein BU17DRAFT_60405 [Hysterangium stoloniferum]
MFNFFRRHNRLIGLSLYDLHIPRGVFRRDIFPDLRNLSIFHHEVEISDFLPVGFGEKLRHFSTKLDVLDLQLLKSMPPDEEDVDQFVDQLYKFPNLRYLKVFSNIFSLSNASVIRDKFTTVLPLLECLVVEFYYDFGDTKVIEIRRIRSRDMCRYTTVERRSGNSNHVHNNRTTFEMWTGMNYSDDFYHSRLRLNAS